MDNCANIKLIFCLLASPSATEEKCFLLSPYKEVKKFYDAGQRLAAYRWKSNFAYSPILLSVRDKDKIIQYFWFSILIYSAFV